MLASRSAKWSAGVALACAVLVAATWFLLVAPRRAQAAETRAEQVSAEQSNDMLRAKVAQLRAQFADLPKTQAELAQLRTQLTATADLPGLVRTISALSATAGTDLQSIVPGAATALGGSSGAGAPAAASSSSAAGSTGVVAIPLSVVASGDYYQVVGFLRLLQTQMPRAFLVTGLQLDSGGTNTQDQVKLSLTGQVFSLPDSTGSGGTTGTSGSGSGSGSGSTPAAASSASSAVVSAAGASSAQPGARSQ